MLEIEEQSGQEIDQTLVDAVMKHGSVPAAARDLGLPYDTLMRWLDIRRIDVRIQATATASKA